MEGCVERRVCCLIEVVFSEKACENVALLDTTC